MYTPLYIRFSLQYGPYTQFGYGTLVRAPFQRKQLKRLKNNVTKVPKAKRNGVINPQNYNVYQFQHSKFRCSQNATNQMKSTVELSYMCPRGRLGPPAVTLTKQLKYEQRLLLRCIHHFKSDLVYNMDHMRISGIEPSSVILIQRKKLKRLKINVTTVPKAKRNGSINPQN